MKIVFLSNESFIEPNLSLVRRLKEKCELYFFVEIRNDISNKFEINHIDKDITLGRSMNELLKYEKYLPLDTTYLVQTHSNKKVFKLLWVSFQIQHLIRKINPDIIVIDSHNLTVFFSELFYYHKSVLIVHDPFLHSGYDKFGLKLLRKISFSLVKKKILLNAFQKERFIKENNYERNDIYVSFLSEYEFMRDFQIKRSLEKKEFTILFFGIISQYKGIEYLMNAVKNILDSGIDNIKLIIAGSGSFYFDISSFDLYKQIEIINRFVPTEELAQLIVDSDIVICPYTDATQSGVVMTAYSLYKPVIVTNVGGLTEMVEGDITGIIVPPKDEIALESAILKLFNNPTLLEEMSLSIRKKYEIERSWEASAKLFLSIFDELTH